MLRKPHVGPLKRFEAIVDVIISKVGRTPLLLGHASIGLRHRKRQTGKQREKHTDIRIDREADIDRQACIRTEKQTDVNEYRKTGRRRDRKRYKRTQREMHADRETENHTKKKTDGQINRQIGRQIGGMQYLHER